MYQLIFKRASSDNLTGSAVYACYLIRSFVSLSSSSPSPLPLLSLSSPSPLPLLFLFLSSPSPLPHPSPPLLPVASRVKQTLLDDWHPAAVRIFSEALQTGGLRHASPHHLIGKIK